MSKDDLLSKLAKQRNTPLNQIKRLSASRAKDDKISGEGYAMLVKRAEDEEQRKKRGKVVKSALMPYVPTTIGRMKFNEYYARYGGTTGMLIKGAQSPSVAIHVFSPADLLGLEFWVKADAITSLNDSDPVSTWIDSSGNGRDATQGTAAKKPIYRTNVVNGKPVVRFDGVDDCLTPAANPLSGAAAGTAFVVVKTVNDPSSGTAQGGPLGLFGSDSEHSLYPYDGDGKIYETFGTSARKILGNPVPSLASWHVYGLVSAANDYRAYLDGDQLFQTGTNTVGWGAAPVIGATRPDGTGFQLLGDIAEILLYSRALSDSERQQIESYLMTKYGLS